MARIPAIFVTAVCLALTAARPAHPQRPIRLSVGAGGYYTNLNTQDQAGPVRLSGYGGGGEATAALGRLGVRLRYLEGSLTPSGGNSGTDIVEGEAMLAVKAASWLSVRAGPHVRSLIKPEGTERWVFWEGRIGAETELGTPRVISSFETWYVLAADVVAADEFDSGQGFDGAVRFELSSRPVWLQLAYRIDRSKLAAGSRTEVTEHIQLAIGIGR